MVKRVHRILGGSIPTFLTLTLLSGLAFAFAGASNYVKGNVTVASSIRVFDYSAGPRKVTSSQAQWSSGILSNVTVNTDFTTQVSSLSLKMLTTTPTKTYATSGTYTSGVLDSLVSGRQAIYGLFTLANGVTATNQALGQPASESSNYSGAVNDAAKGVDGNTNGVYASGSVFHTQTVSPWWQVNFRGMMNLTSGKIFNRTDLPTNLRANNLVLLANQSTTWPSTLAQALVDPQISVSRLTGVAGTPSVVSFPTYLRAKSFRVWQPVDQYLHLAEVELYGFPDIAVAKIQFASSDVNTGPWNFVGPDDTSSTYYNGPTTAPMPYSIDTHRYYRFKITLTGDGFTTPVVNSVTTNPGIPELTHKSGQSYVVNSTSGIPNWLVRVRDEDSALRTQPVSLKPSAATSGVKALVSLDAGSTLCCSTTQFSASGGATSLGTPGIFTPYPEVGASYFSILAQEATISSGSIDFVASIKPTSSGRVEIPIHANM